MIIADNLTALANQKLGYQNSVEACKVSLSNKDVVVPSGAKLADISGLIDEIDAKSWLNYFKVKTGEKTSIEGGDIDFSKVTGYRSMYYLFYGCETLVSAYVNSKIINGLNCLVFTFYNCTALKSLSIDLSEMVTASSVNSIFSGSTRLENLTILGMADSIIYNQATTVNNIFYSVNAEYITNITFETEIKPNLLLSKQTSIIFSSVLQVLSKLYDYGTGVAHTITFNRSFTGLSLADYNLINNAKIEANARNWTVAGLIYSM